MKRMCRAGGGWAIAGLVALAGGPLSDVRAAALEEIVVTAQKREQSLQDVPVAVTAIGTEDLHRRGIVSFDDFLRTVPGASFVEQGAQGNEVKLRGVGNGTARLSPTTAIYLGEVPVIHTGRSINSSYDFHLVDIERVEVLRGPQGQIYGSNSLGGAIKNVPTKPQLDAFSVHGSASGAATADGGESFDGELTLNVPISPTFGVRLTGYGVERGGWFDNVYAGGPPLAALVRPGVSLFTGVPGPGGAVIPVLNLGGGLGALTAADPAVAAFQAPAAAEEDVNDTTIAGGRAMLRWAPTERFTADLMLAYEDLETDGPSWAMEIPNNVLPIVNVGGIPLFGVPRTDGAAPNPLLYTTSAEDFEFSNPTNVGNSDEIFLANLVLDWDLGFATLTSSTSYWDRTEKLATDIPLSLLVTGVSGAFGTFVERDDDPETIIQELRLTSPEDRPFTWLLGLFYQKIDQDFRIDVTDGTGAVEALRKGFPFYSPPGFVPCLFPGMPCDVLPFTGPPPPPRPPGAVVGRQVGEFEDEEIAVFGELAYDILPTVNAAFSFRYLDLEQRAEVTLDGFFYAGQPDTPPTKNSVDKFLPKFTLTWTPADDQLYYFTASKGFRSGTTNTAVPLSLCTAELTAAIGTVDQLPATDPDTLWNYELGAKLVFADNRVTVNGAVYYIDWSDLQSQVFLSAFGGPASQCNFEGLLNVGDASIRGFELEVAALLTDRLRMDASFSITDPTYETDFAQLGIRDGDTIEGTADVQSFLGLQYDFNLAQWPAFLRVDWNYVGSIDPRPADFQAQPLVHDIGEFHQVNLRAGVSLTDNVALHLWVNNVFDEFGVTRAFDLSGTGVPIYHTIRPLTGGATLRWEF